MYLSLLISFLAIGWSLSVISVCGHVWESAYAMRDRDREVSYYLLKNRIYGSVLTPHYKYGSLMRVGEVYEEVIGAADDHVNCERLPDKDYKDEYNPKTYFYNTQLIPDFPYTFIHKQVWNCTQSYSRHPYIQFFRIVSVVQGTRPVDTIFYFDGIEVIKDKTTDQSRQDVNDYATATFKEIKYINPVNNKVVKYDGRLTLSLKGAGTDPLNLFTPVDIFPETPFEADYKIENLQISDKTYKSKVIAEGSNGKTLRIGKAKYSTIGQASETAVCTIVLNDDDYNIPLLYTDQYLPECSIFKPKTKDYDDSYYGKRADHLGKVNNRCFSIVNQELWDCSYETTEVTDKGVSKKVKKSFQRRVTEMVGAIPVEKVEYFGAVSIWKYRLDSKSSSVRIKEIYYHTNIHNQVVFAGTVKLRKPSGSTPAVRQEEAYLYTYNSTDISELPKLVAGGKFVRGDSGAQSDQGKNTNFI